MSVLIHINEQFKSLFQEAPSCQQPGLQVFDSEINRNLV